MTIILRYPSSKEKTGSEVFAPIGKWSTALRCRDIVRNYLVNDKNSTKGMDKNKGYSFDKAGTN